MICVYQLLHFFVLLSSIPLSGCSTICLFIHPSMVVWGIASFCQIGIKQGGSALMFPILKFVYHFREKGIWLLKKRKKGRKEPTREIEKT